MKKQKRPQMFTHEYKGENYKEYFRITINTDRDYLDDHSNIIQLDLLASIIKEIKEKHPNEELVFWYEHDKIYYAGDPFDSYLVIGVKC